MSSPDLTQVSDLELVSRFREGETAAFEALHQRYVEPIYRVIRRRLGDGEMTEDICQETFVHVLRSLDRVNGEFNFPAWIHRIATNLCYDELRRHQKMPKMEPVRGGEEDAYSELLASIPSKDLSGDPVHAFETKEIRELVWQVAQRLPERYRLVLTLRELQGMSYEAIARALNISDSAVETLLYRARLRFKEEYLVASGQSAEDDCGAITKLIAPYLAGKLRKVQAEQVRRHLAACLRCQRRYGAAPGQP